MDEYFSLIEAFEMFNERKRRDPKSLSDEEEVRWRVLRCKIEEALYQRPRDPTKDSRGSLRVPVPLWVCFRVADQLVERYCPVLGEGGLFIATEDTFEPGTKLNLEIIPLRRGLSFSVKAEVVWFRRLEEGTRSGMGMRFIELTEQQRQLIYNLVDDAVRQGLLERRNHARMDTHLEMNVEWSLDHFRLLSRDLCLGGAYVIMNKQLPVGDKLWIDMTIPAISESFASVAEVVHDSAKPPGSDNQGLGLEFVDISVKELEIIRNYMVRRVCGEIQPTMDEPRRHGRLIRRIKTRFQAIHSFGISDARDISAGGVFLLSRQPPPVGSKIEIVLIHPVTPQTITVQGRVVRVVHDNPKQPYLDPGVGVEFEGLGKKDRELLNEFLSDLVRLESVQQENKKRW